MPAAVSSAIYQNRKFQKGRMRPEMRRSGSGMAKSPVLLPIVPAPDRQQTKSRVPSLYILLQGDNLQGILMAWQWLIIPIVKFLLRNQWH